MAGHSLVPQLQDAAAPRPWPALTTHNPGNHTVRSKDWRYIRYADGSEELYDMQNDPEEWANLAEVPAHSKRIAEHKKFLPQTDTPPVPGSAHRLLVKEGGQWTWEGKPIRPTDKKE